MSAIKIKHGQFSGLAKVYSREPDGLSATLRGLAIDIARLTVETSTAVKNFTDNSTGTAKSALVALPLPAAAIDATSAGGVTATALNTSLGKIANAGKVIANTINEASSLLGLPASSAASGTQAAADTIPAQDKTGTAGSGATAATFASAVASFKVAKDNMARLANGMNAVFGALGVAKLKESALGSHALDLALQAIPNSAASADGKGAVAKTDVDAFLTAYANDVATLAAAWNAAMTGSTGALHVVAG